MVENGLNGAELCGKAKGWAEECSTASFEAIGLFAPRGQSFGDLTTMAQSLFSAILALITFFLQIPILSWDTLYIDE